MEYMILRDSIRDVGILMSLLVRPREELYEVVAGNHRFEIAQDLRIDLIPCNVMELSDAEVLKIQVIENANRIESRPVDYIRRLQRIVHTGQMSVDELAYSIHKHPDWVRKLLSLNYLGQNAKELLDNGTISCTLGIELARLPIQKQDELLLLMSEYPAKDFLELIRSETRYVRGERKTSRGQAIRELGPRFRTFRTVKGEYHDRIEKASVLMDSNAKTASQGWDAALEWVMQIDERTLADRVDKRQQEVLRRARKNELINLELNRRKNE